MRLLFPLVHAATRVVDWSFLFRFLLVAARVGLGAVYGARFGCLLLWCWRFPELLLLAGTASCAAAALIGFVVLLFRSL